jgi:3-hydroxyisobutyrate dehydrogenase
MSRPEGEKTLRIGMIGLGDQGGPMAEMMLAAGWPVSVWARRPEVMAAFRERGATAAESPAALAAESDLICLCVTGDLDIRSLVLEQGMLAAAPVGAIIAIHSTIRPETCVELAEAAGLRGVSLLDAPVSGSGRGARAGTLLVMVGGDKTALARVRPAWASFANPIVHMGAPGAAMRAKLINNLTAIAHIGVAHQALTLGAAAGLDTDDLRTAMLAGTARSFGFDVLQYLHEAMRASHVLGLTRKDVQLAIDALPPAEAAGIVGLAQAGLACIEALARGERRVLKGAEART